MPSSSRPPSSQSGPAERGAGLVVPRQAFALAVLEAARVAVDEVGLDRAQAVVVDAEAHRRVVPHVVLDHVGGRDELVQDRHRGGVLEVHRDAALASVAAHRDVRAHPVEVVQRVDLDDLGAEVGEHHRAPRSRDREAEIDHAHAGERRRRRGRGGAAQGRGIGERVGFGPHRVRVGTDRRGRGRWVGGTRVQVVDPADLAHGAELRIVDFDHAAVGEERGVVERFFRRPQWLEGHADLGAQRDPRLRRELGDRRGHQRLVVVQQEHLVDVHADARGRVARSSRLLGALHAVALGRADHEVGEGHPLVDPPAVSAAEHALRNARIADPTLVVRGVNVLDALPRREGGGQDALEQRRRHSLPASGLLAHAQRGADRERGQVGRRHAHPRHARVQWTGTGRGDPAVVGHDEVGERGWDAGQAGERAAGNAAALPLVAGARRDQRVDRGAIGVRAVVAVRGDRAVHQPRVAREQRAVVDTQRGRNARREVLDEDVGTRRERAHPFTVVGVVKVEDRAPLAPVPHLGTAVGTRRVAARRLDLGDLRTVVGEQHPRHRTCDPLREVEHGQAVEHTRHVVSPLKWVPPFGRRRGWRTPASGPRGRRGSTGT